MELVLRPDQLDRGRSLVGLMILLDWESKTITSMTFQYIHWMLSMISQEIVNGAIASVDSSSWFGSVEEEIGSLKKNHTWDLAPLPINKRAIGC